MADVGLDVAAVRTLVGDVLGAADRLDEIVWPTMASAAMAGSAVAAATSAQLLDDRLADVVARLRSWADSAQASVAALDAAHGRHVRRLGDGR